MKLRTDLGKILRWRATTSLFTSSEEANIEKAFRIMAFMIRYKSMDHLSRHFRYRRTRASAIVSSAIFPNLCLLFIHLLRISSTSFCRFTLFNAFLPPFLSRLYNTFFTGKATNSLFKKKGGGGSA